MKPEPTTESRRRPFFRLSGVIFGVFGILAAALTWPLITGLSTRLPGTATWAFDESTFVWNIWYFKHALLDLGASPLHTELIWYPLGIDLILHTYNFFNALIALPLQVAVNLPFASNITLLLATVLSGLGAYLLACYVLRGACSVQMRSFASRNSQPATLAPALRSGASADVGKRQAASGNLQYVRLAALLAALIYAFASNRAIYAAMGHYDMVTTQWLPFYALYLLKLLAEPRRKNAFMAGLFFALAALAEMIFASFLALLSLVLLVTSWRVLRPRWQALGRLALAGLIAALVWAPVLAPIAREFLTGDYALEGWGESLKLSADAVGLVTPTDLNSLFWGSDEQYATPADRWQGALRAVEEGKGRFGDVNTVFLGWITLGLAVLGGWLGRRRLKGWIWSAVVFGVLVLGPLLQVNGSYRFSLDKLLPEGVTFPLPFALLHFIPFINANRAPNRNSVILMLALAVLAGYGAWWLFVRISKSATRHSPFAIRLVPLFAGLLVTLILLEHLAIPLPTTDARVPEIYKQIAAEPGDFAVMQLPLGWRNSFGVLGSEQTQLQYFQTVHGKPMIGGNISRAPDFKMDYFARIPLFQAITDIEMYREVSPELDAAARSQAAALMALYDVRYFITTPPIPGRYPYQDTAARTEAYALEVLPLEQPAFWEQDGYRAYRVLQPELSFPFRVDLGASGVEPYLGQGWDVNSEEQPYSATANWAIAPLADVYIPFPSGSARDVTLRLAVAPLTYDAAPVQRVSILVNGVSVLRDQPLAPGWQTVEVAVPAAATRRGPNRIRLQFAWAHSPRTAFPDPGSRAVIGATGVVSPVNLEVHGFAEAYLTATAADGSQVDLSAGRQGYNIAVLDARSGNLIDKRGFDTAANTYEVDALAAYLAHIPAGRIVVLATKGDATAYLTPSAVAALRGLGSRVTDAAELAGMAHALVGIQGAAAGAAAEVISPAAAYLRVAGDFRSLAAALDWVELN